MKREPAVAVQCAGCAGGDGGGRFACQGGLPERCWASPR